MIEVTLHHCHDGNGYSVLVRDTSKDPHDVLHEAELFNYQLAVTLTAYYSMKYDTHWEEITP